MRPTMSPAEIERNFADLGLSDADAAQGIEHWERIRARTVAAFLAGPANRAADRLERIATVPANPDPSVDLLGDLLGEVLCAAEIACEHAYLLGVDDGAALVPVRDLVPRDLWPSARAKAAAEANP